MDKKEIERPSNLTKKEFDCLELYIKYGNKARAGREAGYSKKSASISATKLINSPKGRHYLTRRMKELDGEKTADANEVMEFLTSVMRGEVQDQFDLDAPLSERIKAANELAKRLIDTTNPNDLQVQINLGSIPEPADPRKKDKKKKTRRDK